MLNPIADICIVDHEMFGTLVWLLASRSTKLPGARLVTVALREVHFSRTGFRRRSGHLYTETLKTKLSVTTRIVVEAERFSNCGRLVRVTESEVVYFAIIEKYEKMFNRSGHSP